MIEFVLGVLTGLLVLYLWNRLVIFMTLRYLEQNNIDLGKMLSEINKDEKLEVINARLEEHNGQFFIYSVETNEFIAQGKTAKEITDRVEERIRDKPVFIVEADDTVLGKYRATKQT